MDEFQFLDPQYWESIPLWNPEKEKTNMYTENSLYNRQNSETFVNDYSLTRYDNMFFEYEDKVGKSIFKDSYIPQFVYKEGDSSRDTSKDFVTDLRAMELEEHKYEMQTPHYNRKEKNLAGEEYCKNTHSFVIGPCKNDIFNCIYQSKDVNDVYTETARISMKYSEDPHNIIEDDLKLYFEKYQYSLNQRSPESDLTSSPLLPLSGSGESLVSSPTLKTQIQKKKFYPKISNHMGIFKSSTFRDQRNRGGHNEASKDMEKRESHNNMEKMRRKVVAHAFDMVLKSIGHQSSRKPSKVATLLMAHEFCKKFFHARESELAHISHLSSSRRDLSDRIKSYYGIP